MVSTLDILFAFVKIIIDGAIIFFFIRRLIFFSYDPRIVGAIIFFSALFGANFISRAIGLPATLWISEKFIEYFLIIIVILFQPEIRRVILGLRLNILREDISRKVIEEVVRAVKMLSSDKMGAIIVIEGSVDTGTFVQGGSVINANISAELIYAIFNKTSPTHDGAVIIRGEKIHMVSAILPISRREIPHVGMRHRAGVGITEETDAISIIVSESGKISLAQNGKLFYDISVESLRTKLDEALKIRENP